MVWEKFLSDFAIGGFFVAIVVLIAGVLGPSLAGVVAALPVRLSITILLGGAGDPEMAAGLVRGAIPSNIGAFFFALSLWLLPRRFSVRRSFLLASMICAAVIVCAYAVMA